MGIYDDMQSALAYELDSVASQGVLVYRAPGEPTGPEWDPQPGASADYPCRGWNITGDRRNRYIAGGFIQSSDVLLSVVPFDVNPTLEGTMLINGVEHQIIMVDPATLDPNNPVVWRIGCRK